MNAFILVGSALAILTYLPLWKQIWTREVEQNVFAYSMAVILDVIVGISIILQNGSFLLPITYAIGSFITVLLILRSTKPPSWTWFETLVSSLVVVCMIVWYFSGNRIATIASSMALFFSSIPQAADAWKRPHKMPMLVFLIYSVANALCMIGGKCWSVEERLFPASGLVMCLMMVIFSVRRFWSKQN